MIRIQTTPEADQDLVEIALYTAASQNSLNAAREFVSMLHDKFNLLARNPELGRIRDDIAVGLRSGSVRDLHSFPVNKYVVFYEPIKSGVRILRIVHTSRDIPELF